eukprot:Nitzschia sp. Nitz4//scaffold141_size107518//33151//34764//NITZ4_004272-RA/size107518-processed-gene-0.131-mRNA-1//-1//CDS//3329536276//6670//frame0
MTMMLTLRSQYRSIPRCYNPTLTQTWGCVTATRSLSSSGAVEESPAPEALLQLVDARLGYPSQPAVTPPINLTIAKPTYGGHALLGRNDTGKSLIGQTIVSRGSSDYLKEGQHLVPATGWMSNAVAHVSFDSHKQLLQEKRKSEHITTYRAISQGGNLNKAAQFLIVRFGLYSLLERTVDTLSTGEIRKVMIIRALSTRPKLLVLDNAFDGLDVASRHVLKDLVQKTIIGFTQDILVQGVQSSATAHTQVLLLTHRPEEIVDSIQTISYFQPDGTLATVDREGRTGLEVLEEALGVNAGNCTTLDWEDDTLPTTEEIAEVWGDKSSSENGPLVETNNLTIQRGEATLLHDLTWTIAPGQRWLVGGGNGAGKSTLSRLLARPDDDPNLSIHGRVRWVSTERHMEMAEAEGTVFDVLHADGADTETAMEFAEWLDIDTVVDKPFRNLSQGKQKLVLIACALASKPDLLVLDEPCQGLDGIYRQRVLALVERVCRATDMGLVYITHHLEELLPSVSHVIHLKNRKDVYNGPVETYDPSVL